MKKDLTILITNDDGYRAKGFQAMIELASHFGKVIGVAPKQAQSGKSQALTICDKVYVKKQIDQDEITIYSLDGTPVDCIKFAMDHLLENQKIDLVLSGINHGSNAGVNVVYSGTMGAALEASLYGIPSIGLSLLNIDDNADFQTVVRYSKMLIEKILLTDNLEGVCFNINFPDIKFEQIKGVRVSQQTKSMWKESFTPLSEQDGEICYMVQCTFQNMEPDQSKSDEWALNNGYVSIVPIQMDKTSYKDLQKVCSIFESETTINV
ncbi:MAG: 5'/3'-nucleotidase SurE [Alistipes sp.]|nr:5'/3'-nucleotidase SurE [Candidatus Alistipes equi]